MTTAQRRALETLLDSYDVAVGAGPVVPAAVFGNDRPVTCEIGFGDGEALLAMAQAEPDSNFLGIEVHRPGIGRLLLRLRARSIDNVRIAFADASEFIPRLPAGSLHRVVVLFPDPWPKKRHRKRRLLRPDLVSRIAERLVPGGEFHVATDWPDYALEVADLLSRCDRFAGFDGRKAFTARPPYRPETKYERRGHRLGHSIWNLRVTRM